MFRLQKRFARPESRQPGTEYQVALQFLAEKSDVHEYKRRRLSLSNKIGVTRVISSDRTCSSKCWRPQGVGTLDVSLHAIYRHFWWTLQLQWFLWCELSEALSARPSLSLRPTLQRPLISVKTQQNLKSWCISKASGLILLLARVAQCSVVLLIIHHESNTKHRFFWAWSPGSRRSIAHVCSKCVAVRAKLVPVTGHRLLERNFLKAAGRTQIRRQAACMQDRLENELKLHHWKEEVGSIEAPWQMTPPAACLKGHSWIQNVCQVMCLIWTWKCNNIAQTSSDIFSHCYIITGDLVLLLVFFCRNNRFFNVSLQIATRPSFHNIQPNKYKEKQKIGLRR